MVPRRPARRCRAGADLDDAHRPTTSPTIVADSGARVVVVSPAFEDHLDAHHGGGAERRAHRRGRRRGDEFDDRSPADVAATTADSPAFWLYSSGTTGLPKGVMHRHGSLQATADTYAAGVLRVTEDDRFLSIAKLFFAYGLGNSLTFPFAVGGTAILEPGRPTPAGMVELVAAEQPTLFFASPGFVAALLDTDAPADTFAGVRATVTAGESLPAELQRRFSERFGHPVLDGIGSTEALHIFLSNTLDEQRPGTSGWPVPGYEATLLDDAGAEVDRRRHARATSTSAGRRWRPATGSGPRRRRRRSCPTAGCAPATSTPAPTTGRGRSSAATTT